MNRLYSRVLCLFFALTSAAWAQSCRLTPGWEAMAPATIVVESAEGLRELQVRVADDAAERAAGYQWICEQDAIDTAVLFVFPKTFFSAFHMRHVFVPLDIYFFDEQGQQVGAMLMAAEPPKAGIKPSYYSPNAEFRYALEIPRIGNHDQSIEPEALRLRVETIPSNP